MGINPLNLGGKKFYHPDAILGEATNHLCFCRYANIFFCSAELDTLLIDKAPEYCLTVLYELEIIIQGNVTPFTKCVFWLWVCM